MAIPLKTEDGDPFRAECPVAKAADRAEYSFNIWPDAT